MIAWTQNWPAPNVSGFIAQLVERRTGIARSRVQAPLKSWIFFRLLYAIVKIAIITARIILHLISYLQFTYDLFHMHHSLTYLSREHMNPKLPCSQRQWLHSSVGRASHRYRDVTGSSPVGVLNFFQASSRNCKNCDHNCEDHPSFDFISAVHIWFISYASFTHHCYREHLSRTPIENASKGTIIRGRRLFQIFLTEGRALNIWFYYTEKLKLTEIALKPL